MNQQPSLFTRTPTARYPSIPGSKGGETSRAAARSVDADTVRDLVLKAVMFYGPLTADETAGWLNLSILTVRPRFSELRRLGLLEDSDLRRPNASGHRAIVWKLAAVRT